MKPVSHLKHLPFKMICLRAVIMFVLTILVLVETGSSDAFLSHFFRLTTATPAGNPD